MCGEYGDENLRPHYHALLFGRTFDNAGRVSENVYRSTELEKLWPHGMSSFGPVTYQSAAYVARYALKKITGDKAKHWYTRIDPGTGELVECQPEFARMSLKPGIGKTWFEKYWREVYEARDGIVQQGGKQIPPPSRLRQMVGTNRTTTKGGKRLRTISKIARLHRRHNSRPPSGQRKMRGSKGRFLKEETMKMKIYAVKDRATDSYGNPMFLLAVGQALRSFTDEINRNEPQNMMYAHPDDFDLYELGEYETDTGEFETKRPELKIRGKDTKIRQETNTATAAIPINRHTA